MGGVRPAEIEQGGDHAIEAFDFAQNASHVFLYDRIIFRPELEQLRRGGNAEERIAEFVRHAGGHFPDGFESAL